MDAALRLTILDELCQRSNRSESPGNLFVEFLAVRDDDKGPVATETAQYFLGKHHHRQALAAALRVPEHTETAPVLPDLIHSLHGTVHTEDLMILGHNLAQAATCVFE